MPRSKTINIGRTNANSTKDWPRRDGVAESVNGERSMKSDMVGTMSGGLACWAERALGSLESARLLLCYAGTLVPAPPPDYRS